MSALSTWRHHTIPPCPVCGRGILLALHRDCARTLGREENLLVNLANGEVYCEGCGHRSGFEGWKSYCDACSAVYEGGEIWQGMAAEFGQVENLAWLKAARMTRGTLEVAFLGWSVCALCRQTCEQQRVSYFADTWRRRGICPGCKKIAERPPGEWRRGQVPACRNCGNGGGNAVHRDCPLILKEGRGEGLLEIDIGTGLVRCDGCGITYPFERFENRCACGAVSSGGSVWAGMEQFISRHGEPSWLGATREEGGAYEEVFRGWWFCLACDAQDPVLNSTGMFLSTGGRAGGLCHGCREKAAASLAARMLFPGAPRCNWCNRNRGRGRIVALGKAGLCRECYEEILSGWEERRTTPRRLWTTGRSSRDVLA